MKNSIFSRRNLDFKIVDLQFFSEFLQILTFGRRWLHIQNFGNGPVVKKLQLFENAKFSENPKNHCFSLLDSPSALGPTVVSSAT